MCAWKEKWPDMHFYADSRAAANGAAGGQKLGWNLTGKIVSKKSVERYVDRPL